MEDFTPQSNASSAGVAATPLPDGKVHLLLPPGDRRKALQDLGIGIVVLGFLLVVGSGRAIAYFVRRGDRVGLGMVGVGVVLFIGYMLLQFLLKTVGSVEWTVGPDYLEVTRKLWGLPLKQRYTGATLEMQMLSNPHVIAFALTLHRRGKKPFCPSLNNRLSRSRKCGRLEFTWQRSPAGR